MGLEFLDRLDGNSLDRIVPILTIEEVLGHAIPPEMRGKSAAFRLYKKPLTTSGNTATMGA